MPTRAPSRGVVRRRARGLAACALTAGLVAGCGGGPTAAASGGDRPGTTVFPTAQRKPAPAISGRTLTGDPVRLADLSGGVVVVNVWASWCTSCREEPAALAAVSSDLRGQPVRFLGIDERDSASAARRFVAATGADYPQLVDRDGAVLHRLSVLPQYGIPSTLVLDRKGAMAARVVEPLTRESLTSVIDSLRRDS